MINNSKRTSQYNTALELDHDIIFRPVVVDRVTVHSLKVSENSN